MGHTPGLRVLGSGTSFVRMPGQQLEYGGWLSAQRPRSEPAVRDRIGKQAASTLFGSDSSTYQSRQNRLLSTDQLWLVYLRVPDVRASIDAITRRVATWDWSITPTLDPSDAGYEAAKDTAEEARRFMAAPNTDGETWQELLTKVVLDLLVFDAGVLENVMDGQVDPETGAVVPGDNLVELVALRGGDVRPIVDEHGKVLGYVQDTTRTGAVIPHPSLVYGDQEATRRASELNPTFAPDQLTYFRLFPNTSSVEGAPLIESLANELITMLRSSEHAMLAFDADEIPPGVLVLTGIVGQAAQAAVADLQSMRGKDQKIRVIQTADPSATGAKWVEMKRSFKDVDFVNVVKEIRRTIWRVFGVQPVEMGASEDIPRAVGEVQVEVGSSHLIAPILELLEGKINARILPRVIGDADKVHAVRFAFDRGGRLSAEEELARARTLRELVQEGLRTRNEARAEDGLSPLDGGDVATVSTGAGPVPLHLIVGSSNRPPEGDGEDGGGQPAPDGKVDEPEAAAPEDGEEAPGEAGASKGHVHHRGCGCHGPLERSMLDDLPSEWQPTGKFSGYRTMQLRRLWEPTAAYSRAVVPLYDRATDEVLSATASAMGPGGLDEEKAAALNLTIAATYERMVDRWALATAPMYRDATKVGRDAAVDFTAQVVVEDWEDRSTDYAEKAMHYLTAQGGLVSDLRATLSAIIGAATRSKDAPEVRAVRPAPSGLTASASEAEVLEAMSAAMVAQRARTANWAGRLVELANQTLVAGMLQGSSEDDGTGQPVQVEWWCEWVAVGDERMCQTCELMSGRGFMELSQLPVVPGGDTECRARCRCVLVTWTREEIRSGVAVLLTGP